MKHGTINSGTVAAALIIFIAGCAKQATPTGGPKDVTPPVMVKSVPPVGTTNFKGKTINITFDEYFNLDKVNEKFIISPPLKKKPKIVMKDKTLIINFTGDLKDSTTYTLNFPDVIRDLNENNPIPNFQYVFSTGNVLDSLSVTGNVVLADNLEASKTIFVTLYGNLADSAPRKMLPDYLSVADANGYFRINNVKGGKYRLYALADNNSNNKYDPPDEAFAFLDSVIDVNPVKNYKLPEPVKKDSVIVKKPEKLSKDGKVVKKTLPFIYGDYNLYLFTTSKKAHYLTSSDRKMPYQLKYYMSIPPDTMKFGLRFADEGNYRYFTEKNKTGDTIIIWLRDSLLYSQSNIKTIVTYPFTDSTGMNTYKNDTIPMRFTTVKAGRGKQQVRSLKISENSQGGNLKPGQKIIISSITPLKPPDTSKITLYNIREKEKIAIPALFVPDSTSLRSYILNARFKEGEKYLFIKDKGSFSDIYGAQSDSSGSMFNVRQTDSYGHLTMDVTNGKGNLIVQLLTEKEVVIQERKLINSGKADFPLLEPGLYRVRVIYDLNGDGKWTTGNFDSKLQPEPVSYFPKELEVKSDWEIIEEWDVDIMHSKDQALREKKEIGK
jgi:uncharacterized protein (DUF2141 family)